jgi:ABC-type glycerol-3-phosphate transport system substrate-binding protein
MSAWVAEYQEKYPNVKIEYITYPMSDMVTKLVTGVEAGSGDTVLGVYGPWLPTLVEGGYIEEAPPVIQEMVKNEFTPISWDGGSYKGKLYGVAQNVGLPLMIMNRAVMANAGISEAEYPDTYADLMAALDQLDKKGDDGAWQVQGACLAPADVWIVIDWASVLFSYGGSILNEDYTAAAFNTPEGLEATKVFKRLSHPDASIPLWFQDACAIMVGGPTFKPYLDMADPPPDWMIMRPLAGPGGRWFANFVWSWVVNAHASPAQKAAAWDFIEFITDPEHQLQFYQAAAVIPNRTEVFALPEVKDDEWAQGFIQYLPETKIYSDPIPEWQAIEVTLIQLGERLVAGELSEQEFLDEAEKRVNEILAER